MNSIFPSGELCPICKKDWWTSDCSHTWDQLGKEFDTLRKQLKAAGVVIKKLLSNLPDSIHDDDESWQWCWDELSGDAQDAVKDARVEAGKALVEIERIGKGMK